MGNREEYTKGERMLGTRLCFVAESPRKVPGRRRALFLCDCGNHIDADLHYVRFGNIRSCGCIKREMVTEKNTRHGNAPRRDKSGAYRSWQAMNQRCALGRGPYKNVTVCAQWRGADGFSAFLRDMGERPKGHTLDRIDGKQGYSPDNCRWATYTEQSWNTSANVNITMLGETRCIADWCGVLGISYAVVKQRRRRGMDYEAALTTPIDKSKSHPSSRRHTA